MNGLDWLVIAIVVAISPIIGVIFTRRASSSTDEFFVAGRSLSWWVAGTSIVATTYSADTPLFIAGMVRQDGIAANWFWISSAIGGVCGVFFFAHLWRRSRIVTDVELIELRYSGRQAGVLRMLLAIFDGGLRNCFIMGSIVFAMASVARESFDLGGSTWIGIDTSTLLIAGLLLIALIYSAMSGIVGVVYTDIVQFAIAMAGAVILAWAAIDHVGGLSAFRQQLESLSVARPELTSFLPSDAAVQGRGLPWSTFLVFMTVLWWSHAPGKGYVTQRLLATRDERHSALAMLWYNIAHYVLRPWPWIIVALCSLVVLPELETHESAYPRMIVEVLPAGLRGLLVASIFAAFMSTLDTHLNWGASYFVNDIYRRFLRPQRSDQHYLAVARWSMVGLSIAVAVVALNAESILGIYVFLAEIAGGLALVRVLRWYWWRINAWSEISAMVAGVLFKYAVPAAFPALAAPDSGSDLMLGYRLLAILGCTTAAWIAVTLLTSARSGEISAEVIDFYRKVRPRGLGWRAVSKAAEVEPDASDGSWPALLGSWFVVVSFIYASLYVLGEWILRGRVSWIGLAVFVLSLAWTARYVFVRSARDSR